MTRKRDRPAPALAPLQPGRRRFLADTARMGGAMTLAGLGLGFYARQGSPLPMQALRPPGARSERAFLGSCVRCGLCVRACPFDTLKLATLEEGVVIGTPYFTARDVPCEMCEDLPCVAACPTGALDPELTDIDDARMGLAALVNQETCLNFQGLRCDVCYRECPAIDRAITLEMRHNERTGRHTYFIPTVHSAHCTGCGKCERVCVLPEAAIKVLPVAVARGASAEHYRWGWEEKDEAGGSLVTPDPEHRYNLPEGLDYDYEGGGLVPGDRQPAAPFPDDPLQSLNRSVEDPP